MKARLPEEFRKKTKNPQLTLYELNKQMVGQLPPIDMTDEEVAKRYNLAFDEFIDKIQNKYYMLLCRELNYFTLFHKMPENEEAFNDVILEIIKNYGTWITWDWADDEHTCLEFWAKVKIKEKEEICCFMLFGYDNGVVEVC